MNVPIQKKKENINLIEVRMYLGCGDSESALHAAWAITLVEI